LKDSPQVEAYDSLRFGRDLAGSPYGSAAGPMAKYVYMIHHGQTALKEKLHGLQNEPLDAAGRGQAEKVGELLADVPLLHIFSSDLRRSHETSDIISQVNPGHPGVQVLPSLRPWNLGDVAGQKLDAAFKKLLDYYQHQEPDTPFPTEGGEPWNSYMARFMPMLKTLFDGAVKLKQQGVLGLVGHSHGMRVADAWVKAGAPANLSLPASFHISAEHPAAPDHPLKFAWDGNNWAEEALQQHGNRGA